MLNDDPWDMKLLFENWMYQYPGIVSTANKFNVRGILQTAFIAGWEVAQLPESQQKMLINSEKKIYRLAAKEDI